MTAAPPDLVAKIEELTPSPTPDPAYSVITKLGSISADAQDALQKITGWAPPPGGPSQVR
jgi:hypothetical protein